MTTLGAYNLNVHFEDEFLHSYCVCTLSLNESLLCYYVSAGNLKMIIATSVLIFMLVHRSVVCDELYPISQVQDLLQNQPEWTSDDLIEPLEGKLFDEPFLASNLLQNDPDTDDLKWMKTNIVDKYGFKKDPKKDIWVFQPNFAGKIGTPDFEKDAKRIKEFFERNNDWEAMKKKFRTPTSCLQLLYITAARYLYVTHVLYVLSAKTLKPCVRTAAKKIEIMIPDSVCFPEPYGSASCTSDYDVGLVGKDAGTLTEKFNNFFQDVKEFGKPSEIVFDTNVYAFTLEYAMPFLFAKLPSEFATGVENKEKTLKYKMQELASAYFKVYKYNVKYFNTMVDGAISSMKGAPKSKVFLEKWLDTFKSLNALVPFRLEDVKGKGKTPRQVHNDEYQALVKGMSLKGGYESQLLDELAKALIYAAEAYHTRGAIRHVVGGTQMKVIDISKSLSLMDLWVSMIENWGESNKEFSHCLTAPLEVCFLKMSKYLWRTFNAMNLIRPKIKQNLRPGLVHFGGAYSDPEYAMKMWLDYKRQGKTAIPKQQNHVMQFLRQFKCDEAQIGQPISSTCMEKMNKAVNAYNMKLAEQWTDKPAPPPWKY